VQIRLRRLDARVAQQDADRLGLHALLDKARGETVPKRMRLDRVAKTLLAPDLGKDLVQRPRIHMIRAALVREQPHRMTMRGPHAPQVLEQRGRQRRQAFIVPLAHHADDPPRGINVLHRDRRRFPNAQAAPIHRRQRPPVHR